jgi:hypothetical protein
MNQAGLEERLLVIENRVQVLENLREIERLHYRYINNLCFAQYDQLVELFAENSVIDFPPEVKGKSAITKHYKESIATRHIGNEFDLLVHPIIKVIDIGNAEGYWLLYMKSETFISGLQRVFKTRCIKENGIWKFNYIYSRARLGWPSSLPSDGQLSENWSGSSWG